jgi:hypothetical protein
MARLYSLAFYDFSTIFYLLFLKLLITIYLTNEGDAMIHLM